LLPLAMIWLAAHVVLLAFILSLKFLTAKAAALILMVAAAFWFVAGRKRPVLLPPPPGMV
jgi:hypothetical protein